MTVLLFAFLFVLAAATLVVKDKMSRRRKQQTDTQWSPSREKTTGVGAQTQSGTPVSLSIPKTPDTKEAEEIHIKPLPDFDWTAVEPEKHRPFKPTYHITMALRTSTPSDLVLIDRTYLSNIHNRAAIVRDNESMVMGVLPEGVSAVYETYHYLLAKYLPARYPSMFALQTSPSWSPDSTTSSSSSSSSTTATTTTTTFLNKVTSTVSPIIPPPPTALACLKILATTIEDDLFLLSLQPPSSRTFPSEHKTVAFLCCHPAGFDPSAKLDKGLKAIHVPVPAYDKIGPSMERYFSRVEVGKSVKRLNWSVQTHTRYFAPSGNHVHADELQTVERDAEVDIREARMRVELQTLTRLPETGSLMFSFKTYLYSLDDIKREGLAREMADAVEGLGKGNAPGMWVYKGGVRWGKRVCEYLRT